MSVRTNTLFLPNRSSNTNTGADQMELHPYLSQPTWVRWHRRHGIHVTAYSPFAGTNPTYSPGNPPRLLNNNVMTRIASERSCTPAQVALQWGMARGTSVIPKTSHYERIVENLHSVECVLGRDDLEDIDDLDEEHWRFNNPTSWGVPLYEGLEDGNGKHKKNK